MIAADPIGPQKDGLNEQEQRMTKLTDTLHSGKVLTGKASAMQNEGQEKLGL